MKKISVSEARSDWSNLINEVAFTKERVILYRRNKDLVAVVPIEDLELLKHLEDRADLAAVRRALKEPGSIPFEKALKELGLDDLRHQNEAGRPTRTETSS